MVLPPNEALPTRKAPRFSLSHPPPRAASSAGSWLASMTSERGLGKDFAKPFVLGLELFDLSFGELELGFRECDVALGDRRRISARSSSAATSRRAFSIWARIVSAPSSSSAIVGSFRPVSGSKKRRA